MAYHFHWPLAEILDLEHPLRRAFAAEIERLNAEAADGWERADTADGAAHRDAFAPAGAPARADALAAAGGPAGPRTAWGSY